jgi:hypothetical protein
MLCESIVAGLIAGGAHGIATELAANQTAFWVIFCATFILGLMSLKKVGGEL